MDLILRRKKYLEEGIFGELSDTSGKIIAITLEHAYPDASGLLSPKIPNGTFICLRGQHQLEHSPQPFATFEVSDVPGHSHILFHPGNYNQDSDGCILLGDSMLQKTGQKAMILNSRVTFEKFMELQQNALTFHLLVIS